MELATGKVCEIPEPVDSLNPDARRLAADVWRRPDQPEPESCLKETSLPVLEPQHDIQVLF